MSNPFLSALVALSLALACTTSLSTARAAGPEDRFGSDEANLENLRVLAEWWGKGSHLELRGGVWLANLSRGPGAAFAADTVPTEGERADTAATRIGSGSSDARRPVGRSGGTGAARDRSSAGAHRLGGGGGSRWHRLHRDLAPDRDRRPLSHGAG